MPRRRARMKMLRPDRAAGLTSHAPSRRLYRRTPPRNPAWWVSQQPTGTRRPRSASRWTRVMCRRRSCRAQTRPRAIVLQRRGSSKRESERLIADARAWARFLKLLFIASAPRRRQRLPPNKRKFAHAVPVVSESQFSRCSDGAQYEYVNDLLLRPKGPIPELDCMVRHRAGADH